MDDGTDFTGLATTPLSQLPALILSLWLEVIASEPNVRAELIGTEILLQSPDVVALVEIPHYTVTYANGTVDNRYDSLAHTMKVLGNQYRLVTVQDLSVNSFPLAPLGFTVTFTDRQAILVKKAAEEYYTVSNAVAHQYQTILTLPSQLGPLEFLRGWIQLDLLIKCRSDTLRIIATHAEVTDAKPIQFAEMQEIFAGPAATPYPVVFLGDFNAGPEVNPDVYNFIRSNGLADAWERTHYTPGYTWAVHPEDGQNSTLNQQIDIIFYNNKTFLHTEAVYRIGWHKVRGRFPSDHLGVVGILSYY